MNVRIEEQNLRFKISEGELSALLGGHCVHVKCSLLDKRLVATINPGGRGDDMAAKLVFDGNEIYLNLSVPPARLQDLSDMGRSRCGLAHNIGDLSLTLQVDLRGDERRARKT